MKQHRLTREEFRRWRENRLALMTKDGEFVRYASEAETRKHEEGLSKGIKLKVRQADGSLLDALNDRDAFKREMAQRYGDCQVQHFNGQKLFSVRDPNVQRPTHEESVTGAPDPDRCQCAKWANRVSGKHHFLCSYNAKAPAHQRGDIQVQTEIAAEPDRAAPTAATGIQEEPDAPPADLVIEQPTAAKHCACAAWEKPDDADPGDHHPTCRWFGVTGFGLYTLGGGKRLRDASHEEIEEAKRRLVAHGTMTAVVDGREFMVMEG